MRSKKEEVIQLVNIHKPMAIALHETKFWQNKIVNISGYTLYSQNGHFNVTAHGGVALYIYQSTPAQELTLETPYQAVAVRVQLHRPVTLCSIYISQSHEITETAIQDLFEQLPHPIILMGDFNSYNTLWGSEYTNVRGRILEEVACNKGLIIMNTGAPTRVGFNTETCIDLTVASPTLGPYLEWTVTSSPCDGDHIPIIVSVMEIWWKSAGMYGKRIGRNIRSIKYGRQCRRIYSVRKTSVYYKVFTSK